MTQFIWFEYVTDNATSAQGFFGELFHWTTKAVPMPGGDYTMIAAGDRTIGGYSPPPPGAPKQAHWLSHLAVSDAKASAAKVASLGGKVVMDAFKVGEFGTMAVVADPQGGTFALWQPAQAEAQPQPAPNTFCWNELMATDPKAAVAFYTALAGFTVKDMDMGPMGTYHVLEAGGAPRAGITGKAMPQAPHAWLPYVQVASSDKTAERAKKLGATIAVPPTDVPNVGRFAILIDPQGAALGILQP